ncbi:T9SS type A sorting domain-containing protein [candidate division KSB1 bacterium]|nr:T9SS type A sorting domain-containing protein [candidate division KSB1 bacterium]
MVTIKYFCSFFFSQFFLIVLLPFGVTIAQESILAVEGYSEVNLQLLEPGKKDEINALSQIKVEGKITYLDYGMKIKPIRNAIVKIYDADWRIGFGDEDIFPDLLAEVYTDSNGAFAAYVNAESDPTPIWPFPKAWKYSDIRISFYPMTGNEGNGKITVHWSYAQSPIWEDRSQDLIINIHTADSETNINSELNKSFAIFDHLLESQEFYVSCIEGRTPEPIDIYYPKEVSTFLYTELMHPYGEPQIWLSKDDIVANHYNPNVPSIIWLYYGVYTMWDLLGGCFALPYGQFCITHPNNARDRAWVGGWAYFIAVGTRDKILNLQDGQYYLANGNSIGLDYTKNFDPVTNIDNVPGRIAGSLYDLYDSDDDKFESYDNYPGNRNQKKIINEEIIKYVHFSCQDNFFEFIMQYMLRYNQSCLIKGACYENGIDYGADTIPPSAPGIPVDEGKYTNSKNVVFLWTEAQDSLCGVADYQLCVRASGVLQPVFDDWIGNVLNAAVIGEHGQYLHAQVRAKDNAGLIGPWSNCSDGIVIDLTPPSAPSAPCNLEEKSFINTTSYTLAWTEATDIESHIKTYFLHVEDAAALDTIFSDTVGLVLKKTLKGAHGQKVYAKVRAVNGANTFGDWSKSSDVITIDLTPPSSPGTPLDAGDFSSSSELVFHWTAAVDTLSGISDYHLQVGTTPGDSTVFNQWIGPKCADTISGEPGNTYYARVRAKNGAGSIGEWSGSSDGITIGILIRLPSLQAFPLDTIDVPIYAQFPSHHYDAAEINFTNYQSGLRFIGIDTSASLVGAAKWSYIYNETDERLQAAFAGAQDITGSGVFCRLTFLVVGDICTLVPITIESALFNTGQDSAATTDGSVYIKPIPFYGDVDENGLVQAHDAAFILKYLVGDIDTLDCQQFANADVTLDSTVSALDATVILQYVVGLIDSLPHVPAGDQLLATASIAMHDQAMRAGQTVELPLYLASVDNLLSFEGTLAYDPAVLTPTAVIWPGQLADYVTYENSSSGEIRFAGAGSKAMIKDGLFATVRFTVNDGCDQPETVVTLKNLRWNENDLQKDVAQAALSLVTATSEHEKQLPTEFVLDQNYPNPFNPSTTIEYGLPQPALVTLSIYDVNGRGIITLVDEKQERGWHQAHWHAVNSNGQRVSSGVYLVKIKAGDFVDTKKMILIK